MARSQYGLTPGEVVVQKTPSSTDDPTAIGILVDPSQHLAIWSYDRTTQYSDLQTCDPANPTAPGTAISTVPFSSTTGRSPFQGPDGVNGAVWGWDGVNWWLFNPADLANRGNATPVTWASIKADPSFSATTIRGDIGAGTSSLTIGTTSSTAKAGDYQPTAANISDATTVGKALIKATDAPTALGVIGAQAQADFPVSMSSLVDGDVATWDDQAQVWSNQQPQQVALPNYLIQGVILNPGQPVPPDFPDGAIAFVRATAPVLGMVPLGKNGSVTTTATVTVNITDAVAVGDNIFVNIGCTPPSSGVTSTITVTDAGSNTFTNRGAVARGTVIQGQVFSARATTALASGAAVTVTLSAAVGDVEVEVSKMTGLASPSFDQSGQASGGGVTSLNVTTNATTAANELATLTVAWNTGTINDPSTWTNGTGWTQVGLTQTSGGSFPKNVATFVKNLTAIGAVSVTPTISASGTMVALLATYKAA